MVLEHPEHLIANRPVVVLVDPLRQRHGDDVMFGSAWSAAVVNNASRASLAEGDSETQQNQLTSVAGPADRSCSPARRRTHAQPMVLLPNEVVGPRFATMMRLPAGLLESSAAVFAEPASPVIDVTLRDRHPAARPKARWSLDPGAACSRLYSLMSTRAAPSAPSSRRTRAHDVGALRFPRRKAEEFRRHVVGGSVS